MQMTSKVIVIGAKPSKGEMEGRAYDSTKIYTTTPINKDTGGVGFAGDSYSWGYSTNFEKIKDLKMPFEAEITFEMVSNGKTSKMIVLDVKATQNPPKQG